MPLVTGGGGNDVVVVLVGGGAEAAAAFVADFGNGDNDFFDLGNGDNASSKAGRREVVVPSPDDTSSTASLPTLGGRSSNRKFVVLPRRKF